MKLQVTFMQTKTQPTPIPIEHGIPIRRRTCNADTSLEEAMRQTLEAMKPLDSIHLDRRTEYQQAYRAAIRVNATIVGRKEPKGGWRVWRVA